MKIEILNIQTRHRINADCMGSFGLGFDIGGNVLSKSIGTIKSMSVNVPDLQSAYLATIFQRQGHDVTIKTTPGCADTYWLHTSLNGYRFEIDAAKRLDNVTFFGAMASAAPHLYEPYGRIVAHPEKLFFDCIDDYPFPEWSFFNYKAFRYFPSLKRGPIVPMLASRGCRYRCLYCPYSSHYGAWTPRDIQGVVDEIRFNVEKYGVRGIVFRDPLFSADRTRTLELLEMICKLPFRLGFACETRVEMVDETILRMMRKAGFRAVHFGIESADEKVLRSVGRLNPEHEEQKHIIDLCEQLGIRTNCFFILGLPEDTRETIRKTIAHACYLNPNVTEFFLATPYPGTELARKVELTRDFASMTGYNLAFKHPSLTEPQLNELKNEAYVKFYLRRKWLMKFIKML